MSIEKTDRKFKRVPLTQEKTPTSLQVNGVPARLLRDSFFDFSVCNAVLKDISLGGAGALVPAKKALPDKVKVVIANKMSLKAKVVHRKVVSEELMFLGLDWSSESDRKCRHMLKLVSQISQRDTGLKVEHERGAE